MPADPLLSALRDLPAVELAPELQARTLRGARATLAPSGVPVAVVALLLSADLVVLLDAGAKLVRVLGW